MSVADADFCQRALQPQGRGKKIRQQVNAFFAVSSGGMYLSMPKTFVPI